MLGCTEQTRLAVVGHAKRATQTATGERGDREGTGTLQGQGSRPAVDSGKGGGGSGGAGVRSLDEACQCQCMPE